tara:strand:+ start:202 stop:627 length:426 start_codon:yes stop_codon:yes gene_type:complete
VDVHDHKTRSYNMSRIRSKDTKPEIIVRKLCHSLGLRFRLHKKDLPGKPDLTFKKYQTVVQVHGCFWHSHSCKFGQVKPKTNSELWSEKRAKTKARDKKNISALQELGWCALVVWECETKNREALERKIAGYFSDKVFFDY